MASIHTVLWAAGSLAVVSTAAHAGGVISVSRILAEGDLLAGSTVSSVESPFTAGNGKVGFVGSLADSRRFIWFDTGVEFTSDEALPDVLTGGESTMGVGDNGEFIYSPSFNGMDSAYTHNGVLAKNGDPAPGIAGQFLTFASRPTMRPDGSTAFVSGLNPTQGSTTTINRVFYRGTSGGALSPTFIAGTTLVDGFAISTGSGITFDYDISDNGAHHAHVLDLNTGSTANDFVLALDGSIALQEGNATGAGENWASFDAPSVNNARNWVVSGDTTAATGMDYVLAYNGSVALREGMVVDGVTLGTTVTGLSINDLDQVAMIWQAGTVETLFVGSGPNLASSTVRLLRTGDLLDITGDGIADVTLTDMNASGAIGPGLDLAEDGFVYLEVGLTPIAEVGALEFDAIIRVTIPAPGAIALAGIVGLAGLRRRR